MVETAVESRLLTFSIYKLIKKEKIEKALERFHFKSGIDWGALTTDDRKRLMDNASKISLRKKKLLFRQGSFPAGIYRLISGKVKVFQLSYDGSIQILFIYNAGHIFGYRPILSNEYQPVSITALEDCELLFIERSCFLDILSTSISLSNQLLVSLSHEFTVLTNRMNVFAQRGIKERLALALLLLNEKYSNKETQVATEIKLSRTDLANFIGTSMENLSRTLNYFKEKKLIQIKGKSIFIHHIEELFILSAIE